ncbi:MAG: hypothetical protein JRJ47_06130 [Deltaproteobacteria bacterium]|nr:hypothetical protein [Deltaproteobacteria bacterium]
MTDPERLCAAYHPAVTIRSKTTLSTLCLYFDEVHCIPFFPLYETKRGELNDFQIIIPFAVEGDEISSFLTDNGLLEDEVLFYQREAIGKLIREETPETENLWNLAELLFKQGHIDMHNIVRSSVMGMLAEKRGWIPVGDEPDIPTPLPPAVHSFSENLSFQDAHECFRLFLPVCRSVPPRNILEARENLKNELLGFRQAMQRLSSVASTKMDGSSLPDLIQEAKSVAENAVEPALNDLRMKIEQGQDTASKHAFGSDLTSVPLIGYAFAAPTLELLGNVLDKESEDVETPFLEEQGMDASMRPGFSLLLKMD